MKVGDIKTEGQWSNKYIWVQCPDCLQERWMRLTNFHRGKDIGLCLSCFNKRDSGKRGDGKRNGHKQNGYMFIKVAGHPRATKEGFVKHAVLVFEGIIGRNLSRQEHVHHINGIRDDDKPENLTIMTNSEHARLHGKQRSNLPVLRKA